MINLSFIISTRNRLPFLRFTLENLKKNLKDREEIIVVDGNSSDGSKEYLQQLFNDGFIHQFISEQDQNQAHGWNKAILMAEGTIIKKIIDDDVFDLSEIRKCANFMLANPEIDVVISNELSASLKNHSQIGKSSRLAQFNDWKHGITDSFTFSDVHLLIKKSAIPYLGLYSTNVIMMDWEYSLRISFLKAKIAYYTGYNALSVGHANSISANKNAKLVHQQGENIRLIYNYAGDGSEISLWSKLKIYIGKILYTEKSSKNQSTESVDINTIYENLYAAIEIINHKNKGEFFTS